MSMTWSDIESRYASAVNAIATGSLEIAITILDDLVRQFPDESLFQWRLAYCMLDSGMPRQAIGHFIAAIHIDTHSMASWGGLGQAYMAISDWDNAEMALRRRLEIEDGPNYRVFLAEVLCNKHNLHGSVEACKEAIALNPSYDEAWFNLGIYYHLLGQDSDACDAFNRAISLDPSYVEKIASAIK